MLKDTIKDEITAKGPMRVDRFMGIASAHYYGSRDPFGVDGDFTTAPEISQLFGEMIGIWIADTWIKLGMPADFILLECGPGRGTLMSDILRTGKNIPGFHDAVKLHLLEISPILKTKQAETLRNQKATWHEDLQSVPDNAPIIVIANEFFDALPIRQAIFQNKKWHERVLDKDLNWNTKAITPQWDDLEPKEGDIFEFSPIREEFMTNLAKRIKTQSGTALIIDYGHEDQNMGNTIQTVSNHRHTNILDNIGNQDITSHVDFQSLTQICKSTDIKQNITTQGNFLNQMGIETRAQSLADKNPNHANDIAKALRRLTHMREMGTLFKVMGVHHGCHDPIAGF